MSEAKNRKVHTPECKAKVGLEALAACLKVVMAQEDSWNLAKLEL